MKTPRSNINAAAKLIAATLGVEVVRREEEDRGQAASFMNITWWLGNNRGTTSHFIHLNCRSGFGAEGTWWSGSVEVYQVETAKTPSILLASKRLVEPWKQSKGDVAKAMTRQRFCSWAEICVADLKKP